MNKASGHDGIPSELFKILKDDAVKVLHSICQQIWKTERWHRTGKGQFSCQSQRKAMAKCSNYHIIALIPHTSNVMVKILQARLQQYVNQELPEMQAGFRKKRQRNQRSNCQHLFDHGESKGIPEKIHFYFIDYVKAFDCVNQNKLWKILKDMEIPDHLTILSVS